MSLERKGLSMPLVLAMVKKQSTQSLMEEKHFWLCDDEQLLFEELHSPKKQSSFLLGRYSAKLGISRFLGDPDLLRCSVCRGALGQPVVKSDLRDVPEISMSHSGPYGASLVFPAGQQFGLDLECIHDRGSRSEAILSRLTDHEFRLLKQIGLDEKESDLLYIIWTMKEALSKVLRCGLTLPFKALELKTLERKGDYLHGNFTHFTQYRALGEAHGELALSMVFPWKSQIFLADGSLL